MDATTAKTRKCRRCNGAGIIPAFAHIAGGKCLGCQGRGYKLVESAADKAAREAAEAAHAAASRAAWDAEVAARKARIAARAARRAAEAQA